MNSWWALITALYYDLPELRKNLIGTVLLLLRLVTIRALHTGTVCMRLNRKMATLRNTD